MGSASGLRHVAWADPPLTAIAAEGPLCVVVSGC